MGSTSLIRDQTLGPLRWEHGALATGPPGKSLFFIIIFNVLAVLHLPCCVGFSLVVASGGCVWPSHCSGFSLQSSSSGGTAGFSSCSRWLSNCGWVPGLQSSCGSEALLLRSMWSLPRPGIKPMSSALAGGFFNTEPPEKPHKLILRHSSQHFTA